jgi:hypothetical protein
MTLRELSGAFKIIHEENVVKNLVPFDLSEYYNMYIIHVLFSSMHRIELWNLEKTIELVHISISLSA